MNYLEIVLQGYFNENNREHLEKYFLRKYKKAEKEQFAEADEFFSGCLKVIEGWEVHLDKQVLEQQKELYFLIDLAKEGKINSSRQDKTIEQIKWETIERCEKKLSTISINDFSIQVRPLIDDHRIGYNLSYNESLYIKTAIQKASARNNNQLKGMKTKDVFSEAAIRTLSGTLINNTNLMQKDKQEFLSVFNPNAVCKRVQWKGSNPELATMIHDLTGIDPIPSLVNKYFITKTTYDSHSKRTDNRKMINIIKKLR